MVEKKQIENFLRLNGLSFEDGEEKIRASLVSARWSSEDIDETFRILDGHATAENMEAVASRQLFRSDTHVDPKTLSTLLGVTVPGNKPDLHKEVRKVKMKLSLLVIYVFCVAILIGGAAFFYFGLLDMFAVTAP